MAPEPSQSSSNHVHESSEGHHGVGMMMMMQMYFTATTHVTLWFQRWHTSSSAWYAISVVGLFALALLQEFLVSYRANIGMKAAKPATTSSTDMNVTLTGGRSLASPEARVKVALTLLYAVNVAISYLLMLAIMTYNVGYFFAIVVGLAAGYFAFFNSASPTATSDVCCPQQHA
ncbi:g3896 [Coccomyxa viridis]|uniref:Copper transport protein n=1 Tax=Coccomyxa viridis TaxID=1274662 RepID=A0ABP1FW26_9CHLO